MASGNLLPRPLPSPPQWSDQISVSLPPSVLCDSIHLSLCILTKIKTPSPSPFHSLSSQFWTSSGSLSGSSPKFYYVNNKHFQYPLGVGVASSVLISEPDFGWRCTLFISVATTWIRLSTCCLPTSHSLSQDRLLCSHQPAKTY